MSDVPDAPQVLATRPKPELISGASIQAIIPRNIDEVFRLAEGICGAGLAPDSYKNDSRKVAIGLMKALELGAPPLAGLAGIAIINGRASLWGDLVVSLIQSKGLVTNHEVIETGTWMQDDFTITFRIWRKGQPNPYEGKFSIADAKTAKLWANTSKLPWITAPRRMLFNRARAFALRDGFADHLAGMAIAEEAADIPPTKAALADGTPQGSDLSFLDDEAIKAEGVTVEPGEPEMPEFLKR